MRQYIIMGAGGHAVVIADILFKCGYSLKGFLDDVVAIDTDILGARLLGRLDDCMKHLDCLFLIGVGDNQTRKNIAQMYAIEYGVAIHPTAVIGSQVSIGQGTVVMAKSVINARTTIGEHCIVNTSATVEHDNHILDFVHV